mgnify:CR=1 FL=1|tara:strand:+ start:101444 stop:103936 length:2493 start_codon:yes stop_codon:yes gene_type:complete
MSTHNTHTRRIILAAVGLATCANLSAIAQTGNTQNTRTLEPTAFEDTTISFGQFSDAIELTTLIDFVGTALNVNIVVKGSPTGEVVFNAPVQIPRGKLIDLLDAMLEQYDFTISYEPDLQFYIVQPIGDVKPTMGVDRASTRIIPTPSIKPSLLVTSLNATLGTGGTPGATKGAAIQAVDELGVLIVNAPPRDIRRVELMVEELIRIDADQQYIRFELDHLAAPTALNRIVALVGGSSSSGASSPAGNPNARNINLQASGSSIPSTGSSLSNLSERLTIDPQGNALIFKGNENEITRVRKVLAVIDVPNTLEPRNYFAGSSAAQIAKIAKTRGLGEIIQIEATQTTNQNPFNNFGQQNQLNQQDTGTGQGGPVMVVDPERGNIIYYATVDQHAQLDDLLSELKTEDERVIIREYVLNHTDALTVTDLLNGIITGEAQTGDSALLPGATNRNNNRTFFNGFPIGGDEGAGQFNPDEITVIADEFSNQVIIKAPINQQEDLGTLITRLDKQRSQVYIQAVIVSIGDNEDFTLAFETQVMAGEFSMGTNFGLSSTPAAGSFTDPKSVATSLGGITAAVIRSDYVPLIVNATQTNTQARILSTPQLLVNDNEESTIVSVSEQPFSEISQSDGGNNISGFTGYEEAGTTLTVTPSISEGGFIRLLYNIELSNFTAAAGVDGSPPPRDRNTLTGSATVPANATIVLGGITVEDIRDTVVKVPLLGDIPLVGELFKRTNKVNNQSKLYVFLTPRIMTDPNFNDLKLFSDGPQREMEIDEDIPELEPAIIDAPSNRNRTATLRTLPAPTPSPSASNTAPPALDSAYIELSEANEKGSD